MSQRSTLLLVCDLSCRIAAFYVIFFYVVVQAAQNGDQQIILQQPALNNTASSLQDVFPYDSALGAQSNCLRDFMIINHAATELGAEWAKQFLDSNGVKPSGTMSGNIRWLGDFDQCRSIKTVQLDGDITISPQYCRLALGASRSNADGPPSYVSLTLGVCAPRSCQIDDFQPAMISALVPELASFNPSVESKFSHCTVDDLPFSTASIIAIVFFSVVGCLMLIGLAVDCSIRLHPWLKNWENEPANEISSLPQTTTVKQTKMPVEHDALVQVLLCFSPYTNLLKLFAVQSSESTADTPNLNVINGIRTLCLSFIILAHFGATMAIIMDNAITAYGHGPNRVNVDFSYAGANALDTFLFLSGFLAYWSMVKQIKARPVCNFFKTIFVIYVHRYLRITVAVVALMLIDLGLYQHFSVGPNYRQITAEVCFQTWWTKLLYVNNLVDIKRPCLPWLWYLALDMQLFILTPFVVFLFARKERHGWLASILALCTQIVCAISFTYAYKLPSTPCRSGAAMSGDKDYTHFYELMYMKPYSRLGPYVIGIICAHLAVCHSRDLFRKVFSRFWLSALIWFLMIGAMITLLRIQNGTCSGEFNPPRIIDAFLNASTNIAWSVTIGWLILACAFDHGGIIGRFLSWPVWAIPARLSYAAYLLHPAVIAFYAETSRRTFNATNISLIYIDCAFLMLSLIVSVPFSLAFDSPINGLLRLQLSNKKSMKPTINPFVKCQTLNFKGKRLLFRACLLVFLTGLFIKLYYN